MLRFTASLSFLWLVLMATSTMAQTWPAVLDADGQPLRSGVEYYVLPAATDTAGGLTLVNLNNGSICPLFVGQEPLAAVVSSGTTVIFTPRVTDTVIRETRDFTVAFTGFTICAQSTAWMVGEKNPETGRRYILAEMSPTPSSNAWHFNIVKNDQGLYNFQRCPNCLTGVCPKPLCGDAGIVVENERRLLVLDAASTCVRDTAWVIGEEDTETTRRLIVIGGGEPAIFGISRNQAPGPYTFGYCPPCNTPPPCGRPRCGIAGILEQNGTRFLTIDGPAFPFSFTRA